MFSFGRFSHFYSSYDLFKSGKPLRTDIQNQLHLNRKLYNGKWPRLVTKTPPSTWPIRTKNDAHGLNTMRGALESNGDKPFYIFLSFGTNLQLKENSSRIVPEEVISEESLYTTIVIPVSLYNNVYIESRKVWLFLTEINRFSLCYKPFVVFVDGERCLLSRWHLWTSPNFLHGRVLRIL